MRRRRVPTSPFFLFTLSRSHLLQDLPQERRLLAGETALAQVSMLSPPREAVYALWSRQWKELSATAKTIPIEDEGTCRLQLWRYDPALFADGERVDPFSLYLSLRQHTDERIESALDEMMEKLAWS